MVLIIISFTVVLIILVNQYLNRKKRFQDSNKLEQIWRYRYYLKIPFFWCYYITKNSDISKRTLWGLLIGIEQSNMDWMYTMDEVSDHFKEKYKE